MEVKILVTGHFSAGKTLFIKTLTGNPISTEVKLSDNSEKEYTTVAMDYGKINIDNFSVHLFGTPGQERFHFMLEILGKNKDGTIILLDGSDKSSIEKTHRFINFMRKSGKPFIVACNQKNHENGLSVSEISNMLDIPQSLIKTFSAKDKKSSLDIVKFIVNHIAENRKAA